MEGELNNFYNGIFQTTYMKKLDIPLLSYTIFKSKVHLNR